MEQRIGGVGDRIKLLAEPGGETRQKESMSNTKQTNMRLSVFTRRQIDTLQRLTGMSQSEVIQMAVDRLYMSPEMYSQIENPFHEMADYRPGFEEGGGDEEE